LRIITSGPIGEIRTIPTMPDGEGSSKRSPNSKLIDLSSFWKITSGVADNKLLNHQRLRTAALPIELFVAATTSLWVFELNLVSALLIVTILACLAITGQRIIEWSGARESGLGLGLVVGCSTYTLFAQVLLVLGISHSFAHWVAVGVPLGLAILSGRVQTGNQLAVSHVVNCLPLSALSVGLLVVALRQTWLMPFALGVASYERVRGAVNTGAQWRILSIIATMLGAAASAFLRPNLWWYFYQGNDAQFFESLSWSVARWSVLEHPGFSGGSIAGYHWLTYAFFGGLSESARLQPWDGLLKIGILIIPTTFALLILESQNSRGRLLTISQGLLVLLAVAATPSTRVDSFTFSILVSFAFIILSGMKFDQRHRVMRLALFVLMSVALIFAKVSTAAIVGAILTVSIILQMIRGKPVSLVPTLSLAGVFVVLNLWLFRQIEAQALLGFRLNITSSTNEIRSLLDNPFLATHFLIWIVLLNYFGNRKECIPSPIALATLGIALFALLTHIALVGPYTSYFGLPAVYLFTLYATRERCESQVVQVEINRRLKSLVLPLALFCATAAGFGIESFTNREVFQGSGLSLLIGASLLLASIRSRSRRPILCAIAVVAGLGVFSGQLINGYKQVATLGAGIYTTPGEKNAASFGSDGLDEVSRYVRKNTSQDAILASNNFCCFGESWFSSTEARSVSGSEENWEQSLGGANYLLPANTQRRFLLQGLRFQTGSRPPTGDQSNRMRLSLAFANRPTTREVEELKRYGVSGYIVNLSLTDRRDWSEFAIERFRSDDFIYLELK